MNLQIMLEMLQAQQTLTNKMLEWLTPLVGEAGHVEIPNFTFLPRNGSNGRGKGSAAAELDIASIVRRKKSAHKKQAHKKDLHKVRQASGKKAQKSRKANYQPASVHLQAILQKKGTPMSVEEMLAAMLKRGWVTGSPKPKTVIHATLTPLVKAGIVKVHAKSTKDSPKMFIADPKE